MFSLTFFSVVCKFLLCFLRYVLEKINFVELAKKSVIFKDGTSMPHAVLIEIENKKYDLVFSLGEACLCSEALRVTGLQQESNPFDWLAGGTLKDRINITIAKWGRFFEKEDLSYGGSAGEKYDFYQNSYNKLGFNHDFPAGIPFDESYPEVKEKYDRRINRLLRRIDDAKRILLVYIEVPLVEKTNAHDDKTLIIEYQKIIKAFPDKEITLLYIESDFNLHSTSQIEMRGVGNKAVRDNICRIKANYGPSSPESKTNMLVLVTALQMFFKLFPKK